MLQPRVQVSTEDRILFAEFFDCLRLDPAPLRGLKQAYETHLAAGGRNLIVVDLCGVDFAGSAVLAGFTSLRRIGAKVVFYNVDENVREVFRLSKLEPLFGFARSREEAKTLVLGMEDLKPPRPTPKADANPGTGDSPSLRARPSGPLRRTRPESEPGNN